MSFNIALSGLNAATTDLNTISNNVANASTTGFKESRAEFGDFFQNAAYNLQTTTTGGGVRTETVAQQFSQGSITTTNNPLDMAISGEGFFAVKDNGSLVYTRNGAFTTDSNGYVTTASGQRLQVYPPINGGSSFTTGSMTDLQLSTAPNPPAATSSVTASVNLPANAAAPADATFSPTDSNSYNKTTSLTVYDSLGAAHTASLYYVAGATAGSWTLHTVVDGSEVGTGTALSFDSSGKLTAPTTGVPLSFTPGDGAAVGDHRRFRRHPVRQRFLRQQPDAERLRHRPAQRRGHRFLRRGLGALQQWPDHRAGPGGDGQLHQSAGPAAARQRHLGADFRLRPADSRRRRLQRFRRDPVRRAGEQQRRPDAAAGEHDERAAQLPGELASHLHRQPADADHSAAAVRRETRDERRETRDERRETRTA